MMNDKAEGLIAGASLALIVVVAVLVVLAKVVANLMSSEGVGLRG